MSPPIPYVVGQWVRGDRFYGRTSQIEEILEGPRNSLWLLGTRRVGKTSLLKQLEHMTSTSPERGYFPIFWDFQGATDPEELHLNFNDALLDAEERLEQHGVTLGDVEADDLFTSLGLLRRKLRSKQFKLLLLCDEVEELIVLNRKDPALLRKLRRTLQSQDDVRSVLASTIRLWELTEQREDTSPFLHGFTPPLYIKTLTDEEACALIRQDHLPGPSRPPMDDEKIETIRDHCDNHPYLIQLVCKRYQETGQLEEAIEQVATDQMVSFFFSVDFEMLGVSERDILKIISEQSAATSDSIQESLADDTDSFRSDLQRLEQLGFIRRNAERRFNLTNTFFRRWLQNRPDSGRPDRGSVKQRPGSSQESATATHEAELGSIKDRYQLLSKVGEGATGIVYKAYDKLLQVRIGVKLLRSEYTANDVILERFRQEIILSRDIGHPNILRIYHLGESEGTKYLTMQWIEGTTLAGMIAEEAPLPTETCVELGVQLASALEAAHAKKILHRDIKPQNVLLDENQTPYLTDFGVARLLGEPGITREGIFLGTPNYASPEQAKMQSLDERSDLYSLGVVLFEMATGRRPFIAPGSIDMLELHKTAQPPDPRELHPSIPEKFALLILQCLAKDPSDRFPNAEALHKNLEGILRPR
jgi:tRNA A-37 threonylcarbamoyl transferase component Bud32